MNITYILTEILSLKSCVDGSEVGEFYNACEGDMVVKSTIEKIPHFNAPIYLENMQQIGKLDEIFGPINQVVCSMASLFTTEVISEIHFVAISFFFLF